MTVHLSHNAPVPHGSARFAAAAEVARAGLFRHSPDAAFLGFLGTRPLWYDGAGGMLLVAGARSGKLRDVLGYNLCTGILTGPVLVLDPKGELAAISQDQRADHKHSLHWNPAGLHGLPQARINPVDYLRAQSPTLVADAKLFCETMLPGSGAVQSVFFEARAREYLEAIIVTLADLDGVLTLPRLHEVLGWLAAGGDA